MGATKRLRSAATSAARGIRLGKIVGVTVDGKEAADVMAAFLDNEIRMTEPHEIRIYIRKERRGLLERMERFAKRRRMGRSEVALEALLEFLDREEARQ